MRWPGLEKFLSTDPSDAGCAETFALLDLFVEREVAHGDAAALFPGVATHFSQCGPCIEDFHGLMAAIAKDSH
jgi:hypothetical protein